MSARKSRPRSLIHRIRRAPLPIIDPLQWDYTAVPRNQRVYCYLYSLARLLWMAFGPIRDDVSRTKEEVEKLRSKATDPASFDSLAPTALDMIARGEGTWSLMVAFPEWPLKPWLAIDPAEGARRLSILYPDYFPVRSVASAKSIVAARVPEDLGARLNVALAAAGLLIIPAGNGCWSIAEIDTMNLKGVPVDWTEFEPTPGQAPLRFLAVLVLDWQRRDDDILRSVADLLALIRPPNIPQDKLPTTKETIETQTMYDLKALGAWYLLWRMNWNWKKAAQVSEKHLGKPLYSEQSEWTRARQRAEKLLREFGGLNPVQSTDT